MTLVILVCILMKAVVTTAGIGPVPLNPEELIVQKKDLFVAPLQEIAEVLNTGLKKNFQDVEVAVVECPDLTQSPFSLAKTGLNGNPRLIEVGGLGHIKPNINYVYDFIDLPALIDLESAFIIGATIGSYTFVGTNCETAANIDINKGQVNQQSRMCKLGETEGSYVQELMSNNETRFLFLANLFASEGKPGPVLKVHLRTRIGENNIAQSIIHVLKDHYADKIIGLGGTFLISEGLAKHHLMPKTFEELYTIDSVKNWFKYFNMSAPLTAVGRLVTGEYGLNLLDHHFHSFSDHGDCGHYYIDTTPKIAEYLGYFNIAESVYRIDRPNTTMEW